MFDDKPIQPSAQPPQNLPIGEPEDLFAQTESSANASSVPVSSPVSDSPSALDAGILKPKLESVNSGTQYQPQPQFSQFQGMPQDSQPSNGMNYGEMVNEVKEPTMSRGLMIAIISLVAIALIGGAGWWVYRYMNVSEETLPSNVLNENTAAPAIDNTNDSGDTIVVPPASDDTILNDEEIAPVVSDSEDDGASVTSSQDNTDDEIIFGETTDTDADGLDDNREASLGTNPQKADSDNDGLTDGDEVVIWGTNPLNADTDGDTYTDGNELKAGYNMKGPGKLFGEKTTTSTVNTTSTP